jgi:hypothetical protein
MILIDAEQNPALDVNGIPINTLTLPPDAS